MWFQTVTQRLKSQYPSSMRRKKKKTALFPCNFQQREIILSSCSRNGIHRPFCRSSSPKGDQKRIFCCLQYHVCRFNQSDSPHLFDSHDRNPQISLDAATERIRDFCNNQLPAEECRVPSDLHVTDVLAIFDACISLPARCLKNGTTAVSAAKKT